MSPPCSGILQKNHVYPPSTVVSMLQGNQSSERNKHEAYKAQNKRASTLTSLAIDDGLNPWDVV